MLLGGSLLLIGVIGFVGLKGMPMKVPFVASCSLAISAACHVSRDEIDPHLAKLQWGVTEYEAVEGFKHCALSSKPVTKPEIGRTYH